MSTPALGFSRRRLKCGIGLQHPLRRRDVGRHLAEPGRLGSNSPGRIQAEKAAKGLGGNNLDEGGVSKRR